MTDQPSTDTIDQQIARSMETAIVHHAILNDAYAWEWITDQANMLWDGRTTTSGYTFDNQSLTYDLGHRIEKYLDSNRPAFQAAIWNEAIEYFLHSVDWYKIADWHFTNMWERGHVADWYTEEAS